MRYHRAGLRDGGTSKEGEVHSKRRYLVGQIYGQQIILQGIVRSCDWGVKLSTWALQRGNIYQLAQFLIVKNGLTGIHILNHTLGVYRVRGVQDASGRRARSKWPRAGTQGEALSGGVHKTLGWPHWQGSRCSKRLGWEGVRRCHNRVQCSQKGSCSNNQVCVPCMDPQSSRGRLKRLPMKHQINLVYTQRKTAGRQLGEDAILFMRE